ncbi:MAG: polysaccharide deacetylase family protein [Kiritimatiellae bacterium]|jgi:peptidoglycan/xylan/chitin deacetylase (PgdA/CDA1 family)|nr:polysaccharide deacetylase family protein [Kiritimatiellia bacterium]
MKTTILSTLTTATMLTGIAFAGNDNGQFESKTEILKWKDGKQAVFMLEFDDSCVTHVKNAIPELQKRGMVGTFYINPGNGPFKNQENAWENEIPATGMEYGNHTFTHKGVLTKEEFDKEAKQCNDTINKCFSQRNKRRLISFGRPGGVPWEISNEENSAVLKKYDLVERPAFFGYPFHVKTKDEMLQLVDKALDKGEMGHHDFHGVGGDWLSTPMDMFIALLDKLETNKDRLWITDPISYHKYLTERNETTISIIKESKKQIEIKLTCKSDSELYDLPLTLATTTPENWRKCTIQQGQLKTTLPVAGGRVVYSANPLTSEIIIKSIP